MQYRITLRPYVRTENGKRQWLETAEGKTAAKRWEWIVNRINQLGLKLSDVIVRAVKTKNHERNETIEASQ